jgi:hypothetical protein
MQETITTEKWYATYDSGCSYEGDELNKVNVWTVSKYPNREGWCTDSGYPGYGLSKSDAEFLAQAANEKIERDNAKRKTETTSAGAVLI